MEYDFVLSPGFDPDGIQVEAEGLVLSVASDGSLVDAEGGFVQRAPVAWQVIRDERVPVTVDFRLDGGSEIQGDHGHGGQTSQ